MRRLVIALTLLAVSGAAPAIHAQAVHQEPLKPTGFSLQAVGLPPRAIGSVTLRARSALAVAVRVSVEDYVPRGLEPVLLIDGTPVVGPSGVTGVQGRVTTLTFLVETPDPLKDGAIVAIQWGVDPKTRVRVPGALRRDAIQAPDPSEARQLSLPSLADWLSRRPSP